LTDLRYPGVFARLHYRDSPKRFRAPSESTRHFITAYKGKCQSRSQTKTEAVIKKSETRTLMPVQASLCTRIHSEIFRFEDRPRREGASSRYAAISLDCLVRPRDSDWVTWRNRQISGSAPAGNNLPSGRNRWVVEGDSGSTRTT